MSPQSRHGKGQASRRARHQADARHRPLAAAAADRAEDEYEDDGVETLPAEGKHSRVAAKKRRHGLLYRWVAAYLPIALALFAFLGAIFVYNQFFAPPTPVQRWQQIEAKWSPAREDARNALTEHSQDFLKQLEDYKKFYTATKGWVDDVNGYNNWLSGDKSGGALEFDLQRFNQNATNYLSLLSQAYQAKTPDEITAMQDTLPAADRTWDTDVALIRSDLGLSAVPATPSPLPVRTAAPTCIPASSGSPSGSPGESGSPAVSPSPSGSVSASGSAAASAAPSPTPWICAPASPSGSGSAGTSVSPSAGAS